MTTVIQQASMPEQLLRMIGRIRQNIGRNDQYEYATMGRCKRTKPNYNT